ADRVAAPFLNLLGRVWLEKEDVTPGAAEDAPTPSQRAQETWEEAALSDAGLWEPLWNLAWLHQAKGDSVEAAKYRQRVIAVNPQLEGTEPALTPAEPPDWKLIDVLTRHTPGRGAMLKSRDGHAVLVVLETGHEFAATENIRIVQELTQAIAPWQSQANENGLGHLDIGLTGNAAVGGAMLLAAQESIRNTEVYTVLLVVLILLVIYRAPMMLVIPLGSIAVALIVSTWLVALLTQVHQIPGLEAWDFKVFKTSKIFIVVILFGAGTDFCLFLIARYREELTKNLNHDWAVAKAVSGVGEALTASAFTTIIGLGMMSFAQFEKYRNSGPAIGLCLLVTLLACLTLAPALLRILAPLLFWPSRDPHQGFNARVEEEANSPYWNGIAALVCRYPGRILVVSLVVLLIPAWPSLYARITTGRAVEVSYDLFGDLDSARPAKATALRMRAHFPLGENSPLTILAQTEVALFEEPEGQAMIAEISREIFAADPRVRQVFTSQQPLGDPPSAMSFNRRGQRLLFLKNHHRTKEFFLTQQPELQGRIALFRVVIDTNPFSAEGIAILRRIGENLETARQSRSELWRETHFGFTGTTASIRDLKQVTSDDARRIELGVVIAVFLVLLAILRKPLVCAYMILSVLLSYYVTLGITVWFFSTWYPDSFQALDWKVPLFLFVILVAIGQDYNIYLATRVFEEQRRKGLRRGLPFAIASTGGIITSCGLIMAGTFASMCMGTLLGVVEIGFALSVGVLVDTFIVRSILLP
ncbi:MAG: MMPL family transporter, partial [Pirellulaceae bacterium]